ncbi:DUF732 domain-containing protein [Mycobacterium sp. Aquia_216]|uniref:DUF732 domain-containing protein n=1 Tax=Mycobacterium sp. Aquia_216 TaxID=2991729 RepID=UPI00227B9ECF|nr:DUF732 domain-containing protein [Mycobacterium sp. Aquia_216]WAJ46307.1 DUF732 domain-containing protein [Mycobacterium sp. Aquia_216]
MKKWPALLGISMGIIFAVPAHADPGMEEPPNDDNNDAFIADLHKVGINFQDPAQAVSAGKTVCGLIHHGVSGLQLLNDLKDNNPGLSTSGAAQFATLSAKSYCPRQLQAGDEVNGKNGKS